MLRYLRQQVLVAVVEKSGFGKYAIVCARSGRMVELSSWA